MPLILVPRGNVCQWRFQVAETNRVNLVLGLRGASQVDATSPSARPCSICFQVYVGQHTICLCQHCPPSPQQQKDGHYITKIIRAQSPANYKIRSLCSGLTFMSLRWVISTAILKQTSLLQVRSRTHSNRFLTI